MAAPHASLMLSLSNIPKEKSTIEIKHSDRFLKLKYLHIFFDKLMHKNKFILYTLFSLIK